MNKILSKAVLSVVLLSAAASANAEYTFSWLSSTTGTDTYVYAINNAGTVLGDTVSAGSARATVWNNGVATQLTNPQGNNNSSALAINNSGQIVGNIDGNTSTGNGGLYNNFYATVWNNGVATQLTIPQGTNNSSASDINDLGQIVGNSSGPTVWNNGVATQLTIPQASTFGSALAINNSGMIVGYSGTSSNQRATLWIDGEAFQLTSPESSIDSWASDINNSGQIVGDSRLSPNNYIHATIWNLQGLATDLTPEGRTSSARAINNSGQIVGYADGGATLWNNGVATDLNSFLSASDVSAGWVLNNAQDINDNGDIVGWASNSLLDITSRSFLLQSVAAVPEADTSAMLLMGAGVMGFMARRRKQAAA